MTELKRRLELIGLKEDVLDRYSFELSGGMRQRVTIIMSTLLNPSLLIADEVTSALDVSTQRAVGEMLLEFRDRGFVKSAITITHDLLKKLDGLGKSLEQYSLETVRMFHDDALAAGFTL